MCFLKSLSKNFCLQHFILLTFKQAEFMCLLACIRSKNEHFAFSHIREICIKVCLENIQHCTAYHSYSVGPNCVVSHLFFISKFTGRAQKPSMEFTEPSIIDFH